MMNRKSLRFRVFAFLPLGMVLSTCSGTSESDLAGTEVPAPILKAFSDAYPRAVVREYSEEIEDGRKVYELSFRHDGRTIEIIYSYGGEVIAVEESISSAELPQSVRDELNNRFDEYEIEEAEKITKGVAIFYEVELSVKLDGQYREYELLFTEGGLLIDESDEENDDDDEDDEP